MSKVLIVYGYYDESDRYGNLLKAVKEELTQGGVKDIEVVNTFAFTQKHLKNNEVDFTAPTADWFRGHRTPENDALIKAEQDKVINSTHIIFLYPIWWESLPHYMTSWLSEVFRSVSFRVGQGGEINPQWIGDREVLIMTTAGFNQEQRRACFESLLDLNGLKAFKQMSDEEKDKFMNMSQTYPLMMALNYSGLKFSKQCHISGSSKGDEPHVIQAAQEAVKDFLKPKAKDTQKDTSLIKKPVQDVKALSLEKFSPLISQSADESPRFDDAPAKILLLSGPLSATQSGTSLKSVPSTQLVQRDKPHL